MFERHRGGVLAAAQQVDLDQVDRTLQEFALFPQVQLAAALPRGLVAGAEQLDRGDQTLSWSRAKRTSTKGASRSFCGTVTITG